MIMREKFMEINITEARNKLSSLLSLVEKGEEVIIVRRGKEIARILPPSQKSNLLPCLKDFRSTIKIGGESLSNLVIQARDQERY
jgi:prevent-host-death family protein